jgi:cell division septal protein FtsQ
VDLPGRKSVSLRLAVPGLHNVRNAAIALAVLHALDVDATAGAAALAAFGGVGRRFERVGEAGGVTVVDDYAHHPTEVTATLAAARQAFPGRRVVAVFQPHLYSRTALHGAALGEALAAADVVVVAPIYAAREQPEAGGGVTHDLVVRSAIRAGAATVAVRERADLTGHVARAVRSGDVVFTLGAGDVTRLSRRALWWGGAVLAALALWLAAPPVLRRLAFFRVRQIEVVGVRNLDPDAVLAALRLAPRASVFDDTRLLADRVRGLAGVADARVVRRLPAALKVIVQEVEPVALVPGAGGLVAVDAGGRPLPFDPARAAGGGELDLPIAQVADSGIVQVLARIQAFDPVLFQDIDAARRFGARGDVLLELGSHRVLLARDAGPEVVQAVVLVARDLAAKARRYAELDARYAGQVVVRRKASA